MFELKKYLGSIFFGSNKILGKKICKNVNNFVRKYGQKIFQVKNYFEYQFPHQFFGQIIFLPKFTLYKFF